MKNTCPARSPQRLFCLHLWLLIFWTYANVNSVHAFTESIPPAPSLLPLPFWKNWWFPWLLACSVILAMFVFYRLRINTLRHNNKMLEEQIKQSSEEILEQEKQLTLEKNFAEQEREIAEKARHDIILLSEIGREISASLDIAAIQNAFYAHVSKLMDADVYGIGMVDWEKHIVTFDNVMDRGNPIKHYYRSLDETEQPATRCILHVEELSIGQFEYDNTIVNFLEQGATHGKRMDDSNVTRTNAGLYVPMLIDGQVIGVITVLSVRPYAYNSSHLDMLRTLGAYAAVALDKANAYNRLKLTQTKLIEQEKLAALGAIVAAVAHELNTPIGNSLLVASSLKEMNDHFLLTVRTGSFKRSEMEKYSLHSNEAIDIILRNLDTSAQLVSSFKQISADQTSNQRRTFYLEQICKEIALTQAARLRREGHQLNLQIDETILMDSFPGALGQVLNNLIMNAIIHGFDDGKSGRIDISAECHNKSYLILRCKDNGKGIPQKHIKRIFEPFFTTRLGQGGSGLGLHISYNIVHSILGGSITVQSKENEGTCFILEMPLVAPQKVD